MPAPTRGPKSRGAPQQPRTYMSSPLAQHAVRATPSPSPPSPTPAPVAVPRPRPILHPASSVSEKEHFDESRHSGVGTFGVGLGLLSETLSDDESDSDDDVPRSPLANSARQSALSIINNPVVAPASGPVGLGIMAPIPTNAADAAKHRALFAATQTAEPSISPSTPPTAPPPSYAHHRPAPLHIALPQRSPLAPPYLTPPPPAHSPHSPLSPHYLPPSSPITPLFAAPPSSLRFSPAPPGSPSAFSIMRSEKEDSLPVRKREPNSLTTDGDAFWRRFSMVAKSENRKAADMRKSPWLTQRLRTSQRLSRLLLVLIVLFVGGLAGGIAAAWILTHRPGSSMPEIPVAVGGSAGESGEAATTSGAGAKGWVPPNRVRAWVPVETGAGAGRRAARHRRTAEALEALDVLE